MTDQHDPRDELASAHLDGRTTAEDAARVAADPDLQARVAALRAARDAVRAGLPAPDPVRREQAITAALAAFDAEAAPRPVTDLRRAAERRAEPSRARQLIGIAAVVALLALTFPLLSRLGSGGDDEDQAAESTSLDASADRELGAAVPEAAPDDTAATLAAGPVDLGDATDLDALTTLAGAEVARTMSSGGPGGGDEDAADDTAAPSDDVLACLASAEADAAERDGTIVLQATAALAGLPVVVTVVEQVDGTRLVRVADPADGCAVVALEPLP